MVYNSLVKFQKALFIGVTEASLDKKYWKGLDNLIAKKAFVAKESPQIEKEIKDADCLFLAFATPLTKDLIDKAPKLKYIGQFSTAFGRVDVDYAKKKGIPVTNLAGFSTESVAEFTIAAILEAIRGLETGKQRGKKLNVDEGGIKVWEIKGKNFGILGLGKIGRRVGELANGFGAHVIYWSRNKKKDSSFKYQELDEVIKSADFLSINLAQNAQTEKILNKKRFSQIKPGCVVINTCPMELIDLDGLTSRLAKKDIIFILDHSDEMAIADLKKLSKYPNCIIYPPMAYISEEAKVNRQEMFVSNIVCFQYRKLPQG
ncbi:MAG: Glycerate dehydrogenase [Candidatus Curtissbacteria bacterium GW2011_GWA1_41_11]|uniref:Glycerate dehydrogenase n=1 Tax=Candidatus Curtissbacteria bacterium GW2011_GWA1_41_11 TaxID=1618409 RepID=A0A0G0UES9_9BACT|nr:MAG: Glycerate dehydrogenase [Candidatus Curtissbacteria bacterium GW2011_GWA1_41_11]